MPTYKVCLIKTKSDGVEHYHETLVEAPTPGEAIKNVPKEYINDPKYVNITASCDGKEIKGKYTVEIVKKDVD